MHWDFAPLAARLCCIMARMLACASPHKRQHQCLHPVLQRQPLQPGRPSPPLRPGAPGPQTCQRGHQSAQLRRRGGRGEGSGIGTCPPQPLPRTGAGLHKAAGGGPHGRSHGGMRAGATTCRALHDQPVGRLYGMSRSNKQPRTRSRRTAVPAYSPPAHLALLGQLDGALHKLVIHALLQARQPKEDAARACMRVDKGLQVP